MVTVDGVSYELPAPFFVIATQNPADFHGTYPLPEAQLDRFLMRLTMGYPTVEDEKLILDIHAAGNPLQELSAVAHAEDILKCQSLIRHLHVSDRIRDYIVTLVDATRHHSAFLYGCSPRASLALLRAAQASAALDGRNYVLPRDIRDLALPVLAHRLPLRLQARGECSSSSQALQAILDQHPVEKWEG
jgi:MoxR-like ATPase